MLMLMLVIVIVIEVGAQRSKRLINEKPKAAYFDGFVCALVSTMRRL